MCEDREVHDASYAVHAGVNSCHDHDENLHYVRTRGCRVEKHKPYSSYRGLSYLSRSQGDAERRRFLPEPVGVLDASRRY